jgi:hypothetical protein
MRLLPLALACALLLISESIFAAPSRVVVLRPAEAAPTLGEAITRVEAELRAAGFEVVVVQSSSAAPSREELEGQAEASTAVAGISISYREGAASAELWVVDQVTDKTVIRTVNVDDSASGEGPSALAIRAVELLRASLIEVTVPTSAEPDPTVGVPEDVQDFAEEGHDAGTTSRMAGLGLELDAVVIAGFDRIGPSVGPAARLSYLAPIGIGGRLTWLGPTFGGSVSGAQGDAQIRQEALLVEAVWSPVLPIRWLVPSVAVGGGFYHLSARGELDPPATSRDDDVGAGALAVGVGLGAALSSRIVLRAEVTALVSTADLGVRMGGEQVGTMGRPSLAPTVGMLGLF